ncbi:conserved hypothetical protein, steroid delta-isomerase-related [Neorhodopirellula lusitana]|uniref:SnoaL-like domain-containing protein n=1 Tax=Neorhodopirellula lusitana TaxID=445327 RepID=A0ABY1Q848_9BACT|nr:ester cyclase [Neorhodopirellula lusitana]SMP61624.1 conserved hypothetical protein, steroid delta-isomerase-related [Neorhodopirellula lusitana]
MGHCLESRLKDYYDAWSRQDGNGVMSFFGESSTFEDLAFGARFEGLTQIRSFVDLTYAGSPDFRVRPTQIVVGEGSAAAAWVMSGTHSGDFPGLPATGKKFEVRASSIIRFDRDTIKTIVDYWNPAEFQRSVGLA